LTVDKRLPHLPFVSFIHRQAPCQRDPEPTARVTTTTPPVAPTRTAETPIIVSLIRHVKTKSLDLSLSIVLTEFFSLSSLFVLQTPTRTDLTTTKTTMARRTPTLETAPPTTRRPRLPPERSKLLRSSPVEPPPRRNEQWILKYGKNTSH
jgi:hypothetical protein